MKKNLLVSLICLSLASCQNHRSEDSAVKSHPLDEMVNETITMSLDQSIKVGPGEKEKIFLGNVEGMSGSVLVYVSADMLLKGDDLSEVSLKLIEPPYYDGEVHYTHNIFVQGSEIIPGIVELDNEELIGNNPGDEPVEGEWFIEFDNSVGNSTAILEFLTIKIHTRLD